MFSLFMMSCTALPLGQSTWVWQLNQPAAVFSVADGVESPWKRTTVGTRTQVFGCIVAAVADEYWNQILRVLAQLVSAVVTERASSPSP